MFTIVGHPRPPFYPSRQHPGTPRHAGRLPSVPPSECLLVDLGTQRARTTFPVPRDAPRWKKGTPSGHQALSRPPFPVFGSIASPFDPACCSSGQQSAAKTMLSWIALYLDSSLHTDGRDSLCQDGDSDGDTPIRNASWLGSCSSRGKQGLMVRHRTVTVIIT